MNTKPFSETITFLLEKFSRQQFCSSLQAVVIFGPTGRAQLRNDSITFPVRFRFAYEARQEYLYDREFNLARCGESI